MTEIANAQHQPNMEASWELQTNGAIPNIKTDVASATPTVTVTAPEGKGEPQTNGALSETKDDPKTATATAPAPALEDEHPDAHKIRHQVEFYFSDENLRTDLHMLQCCNGRENEPISVSRICGFRKMRQWKKAVVVKALKDSKVLELVENNKRIRRVVPLAGLCLLDEDFKGPGEDDEIAYDPRSKPREVQQPVQKLPQAKKVYPPGVTKNMLKPTGFEDAYVEGPLRPEEHEEELAMYDPDKPFVERIEIAIQRFKQKRRMHEMYSKIFNKFMKFGGVECEPRMFGALSPAEMKTMTAEEIARATATHTVPWDREDEKKWVIDFVSVGEGFLSSFLPSNYGHHPNQVKTACQVLRSFYNYLLFHSVCDEHRPSLLLARDLCDKAEVELPATYCAGTALPGPFNAAASTVVGGSQANTYAGNSGWANAMDAEDQKMTEGIGMETSEALQIFKCGIEAMGPQNKAYMDASPGDKILTPLAKEETGLEITAIHPATDLTLKSFAEMSDKSKDMAQLHNRQPLGKLICKAWRVPDFRTYDLPPGTVRPHVAADREFEFWVEDAVLQECFVGLKMDATVLTLTGGITILDEVKETFCSFFKALPNELWEAKKAPKLRYLKKGLEDAIRMEEELAAEEGKGKEGEGEGEQMAEGDMSDDEPVQDPWVVKN